MSKKERERRKGINELTSISTIPITPTATSGLIDSLSLKTHQRFDPKKDEWHVFFARLLSFKCGITACSYLWLIPFRLLITYRVYQQFSISINFHIDLFISCLKIRTWSITVICISEVPISHWPRHFPHKPLSLNAPTLHLIYNSTIRLITSLPMDTSCNRISAILSRFSLQFHIFLTHTILNCTFLNTTEYEIYV